MSCDAVIDLVGKVMTVFCENVENAPVQIEHEPTPAFTGISEKTHEGVKVLTAEEYKKELEKRKAAAETPSQLM